jgi:hypothetical protein
MLSYQGSYFKIVDCDISALDGTEVKSNAKPNNKK